MNTIEMPADMLTRLEQAAASQGLTSSGWLDANLTGNGNGQVPLMEAKPKTLADLFAGHVGRFSSGNGEPRLDTLRESFADYLEEKHRTGHL